MSKTFNGVSILLKINRNGTWLLVLLAIWLVLMPIEAQSARFTIAYDETRSALFEANEIRHIWTFTGEARDMITIRAQRIAGQFTPRMRLLDANGEAIDTLQTDASNSSHSFPDTSEFTLDEGLPEDGTYQIELIGVGLGVNRTENPDEYSLTLRRTGQRRLSADEGLTPLPAIGLTPPPTLEQGSPTNDNPLSMPIYGGGTISEGTGIGIWQASDGNRQVNFDNNVPVRRGIASVTFLDEGVGFIAEHSQLGQGDVPIFTTQTVTMKYSQAQLLYTITLENGTEIITDLYRVGSVQIIDDLVAFEMLYTGDDGRLQTRRVILSGGYIEVVRRSGSGPGEEPRNIIRLEDAQYIDTDLEGWQTLAYLDGELRVLYNNDSRLMADDVRFDQLIQNDNTPHLTNILFALRTPDEKTMQIDWRGMGDVVMRQGRIEVLPLDGRRIAEAAAPLRDVIVQERAVQFARNDGSYRLILPDGTQIDTPADITPDLTALPHQANYAPRGFNNLGTDYMPTCPCIHETLENAPVNPANGNFYYAVTDFTIPSHTLALELKRHYNSQDQGVTPQYMLDAPDGYFLGQMGTGWRHSYQYELDITHAPRGIVTLILPDGTRHRFNRAADSERYTSATLLPFVIERTGGALGSWQATRNDGIRLFFDRAGRIMRISEAPNRSIAFSPVPLSPDYDFLGESGVFIIEPYGRRLELYADESGNIVTARDSSLRQIQYTYDDSNTYLTGVQYITPAQQATYAYGDTGTLARFDDPRSPYHPVGEIDYDANLRVTRYTENPEGDLTRTFRYAYESDPRQTRELTVVNGEQRVTTWAYTLDNTFGLLLTDVIMPREDFRFTYTYTNGVLTGVRQPTLTTYTYQFDNRGNLTRFKDPLSAADADYEFIYEQQGAVSVMTSITYPNVSSDVFTYESREGLADYQRPKLIRHRELVLVGINRLEIDTHYQYDDWGRLKLLIEPATGEQPATATLYQYDSFGYVAEVWLGVPIPAGQAADVDVDLLQREQALRVLRFDHDIIGQLRAITDQRGSTLTLNWDSSNDKLREIEGPLGVRVTFSYDEFGRLTLMDDRGQEIAYLYDGLGNIRSITDAEGQITTYTHDEAGNLLTMVDNNGRRFTYTYDAMDNLTRATSPGGLVTTYETFLEDVGSGRYQRRVVSPSGRIAERRYDALGRLRQVNIQENDIRQVYNIEYSTRNQPVSIQKENGHTLTLEYDLIGRVMATAVANARTEYRYDNVGNLIAVVSPSGRTTRFEYDTLGNITAMILPDGTRNTFTYDDNNNVISATDANNLTTTYIYNALNQLTTLEDPQGHITSFTYDGRGNVQTEIDPLGVTQILGYDLMDRIISMTDGTGQETLYDYDRVGRLSGIDFQAEGRDMTLTYDTEGNISTLNEYRDRKRTLYNYDTMGRVTSVTNSLGHTTAYRYNSIGKISRIIDAVGNEERYSWNASTLGLRRYTDEAGRLFIYENTDALGRVLSVLDDTTPDGRALNTRFTYDADGFITQIVIATDGATANQRTIYQYTYSPQGWLETYTDPDGGVWQLDYDDGGRLTGVINPAGVGTSYRYDGSGNITQVVKQVGTDVEQTERYEYDAAGNMVRYTAPNGVVNTYTYDANGRVIDIIEAVDSAVERRHQFEYNGLGELTAYIDPLGNTTRYLYSRGSLAQIRRTIGDRTIATFYEYDLAENLTAIRMPNVGENGEPIIINMTYDALNRRVRYVDSEANVWAYTYDEVGNVTQISDPLGSVVGYSYDTYNRLTQVAYPDGSVVGVEYDTTGNFRGVTLPETDGGQNPPRQTLTYVLDVMGNVVEIRDVNTNPIRFEYDAMNRVTRRVGADGRETRYVYDAAGRLTQLTYVATGETIQYVYDTADRLTQVVTPTDRMIFIYDELHNLTRIRTNDADIQYRYDAAGNLLERNAGDLLGQTRYIYDDLYRPTRIEYGDHFIEFEYDDLGQITEVLRSNNVRTFYAYDREGRPVLIQHFGPSNERLDRFDYRYDGVGNLIRLDRVAGRQRSSILYSYSVAHRLIDERWLNDQGEAAYSLNFRYDDAGNRVEEIRNGQRTLYLFNNRNQLVGEVRNYRPQDTDILSAAGFWPGSILLMGLFFMLTRRRRLRFYHGALLSVLVLMAIGVTVSSPLAQTQPVPDVRYEYDVNGNLSRIIYGRVGTQNPPIVTFTYDSEHRLVRVQGVAEDNTPVDTTYTYDAMSRLTGWNPAELGPHTLFYDGRQPLGKLNTTANALERYLDFAGERWLTILPDGEAMWHLNDQFGSTRQYTDMNGNLITTADRVIELNAFGERIFPFGLPDDVQLDSMTALLSGEVYDPTTNLYVMGLRTYDPHLGRFIQPDPLRADIVGTPYTFVRNRPTFFTDPTGMTVEPVLDPTQAAIIPDVVRPETLIPHPELPDIPAPPAVHIRQGADNVRALYLLDTLRYGVNEPVAQLSPFLDAFYTFQTNPTPSDILQLRAGHLHKMLDVYTPGLGWQPQLAPDPYTPINPYALVQETIPLLQQAVVEPGAWCAELVGINYLPPVLPIPQMPSALPAQWQAENDLQQLLSPLSLLPALEPEVERLMNLEAIIPDVHAPDLHVTVPQAPIEPQIAGAVDAFRLQRYDFLRRIYTLGVWECARCDDFLSVGAQGRALQDE